MRAHPLSPVLCGMERESLFQAEEDQNLREGSSEGGIFDMREETF